MERIIEIDFQRCLRAVTSKALALVLALILGLMTGFGVSLAFFGAENEYTVYSEVSCVAVADISLVPFFAEVVKTANVAQRASQLLHDAYSVNEIMGQIQANYKDNVVSGVPVIEIGAVTKNPEETVAIVDAVTEAFIAELQTLMDDETFRRLGNSSNVVLIYNANGTRMLVTVAVGLAFVLLLVGIIILREILALHLTTVKDGLLGGQLKLIGVIPRHKK